MREKLLRSSLRNIGTGPLGYGPYEYDKTTLEGWFDYEMSRLAKDLKQFNRYPFGKPRIWHYMDKAIPDWFQELLGQMGIEWITERPGAEANYIVCLTRDMQKFHETYLCT